MLGMAYELNCKRKEVKSAAINQIAAVREALQELTRQNQGIEIADRVREAKRIEPETTAAVRELILDQLSFSTENFVIMQ
jgi:hypothetical protein